MLDLFARYRGPASEYASLGMEELWLPTAEGSDVTVESLWAAVEFIGRHKDYQGGGERVYLHCKAGHDRSASVAFAWLFTQNPYADPAQLCADLGKVRRMPPLVHRRDAVVLFMEEYRKGLGETHSRKYSA